LILRFWIVQASLVQEDPVSTTTITEQVADFQQASAGQMQADVAAAFAAEQRALAADGRPSGIAEPGTALPDADLLDVSGQPVKLAAALDGRPAVIVFYRGGWCPYCNIALRTYQAQLVPALADRGISLVAISPQTPDGSLSTKEAKKLTFTVLSDPGNQIARELGILTAPSDAARAAQLKLGLDLTQVNADGTTGLPMPTVLIADADRVIRWIDVHPDYTTRTEPGEVLQAIKQTIAP
jgi:peroxiredoxin